MRYTAVQLHSAQELKGSVCELVHGVPQETITGKRGPIALFTPEKIVAYLIEGGIAPRLFVFRTLGVPEAMEAQVPGVQPGVRLLLAVETKGRIERVRRLFAFFDRDHRDPSDLGDLFFLRVSHLLGGRLPAQRVLQSLLNHETPSTAE